METRPAYLKFFFVAIFLMFTDSVNFAASDTTGVIKVYDADRLVKEIYYKSVNEKIELTGKVYFNEAGKQEDSLEYIFREDWNVYETTRYVIKEGHYTEYELRNFTAPLCEKQETPNNYFFLNEDLCPILNAHMPFGSAKQGSIGDLIEKKVIKDTTIFSAIDLNVIFKRFAGDLSNYVGQFQKLKSLVFKTFENKVIEKKYIFEYCTVTKIYTYSENIIYESIDLDYGKTEENEKIIYRYEIE